MERKRGLVCSGLGEGEEEVWFENLCKYMGKITSFTGECVLCTVIVIFCGFFLKLFLHENSLQIAEAGHISIYSPICILSDSILVLY